MHLLDVIKSPVKAQHEFIHISTQIGFKGTIFLSVFINVCKLVEIPLAAVTISLKATSVIFRQTLILRRRNPLAISSVSPIKSDNIMLVFIINYFININKFK